MRSMFFTKDRYIEVQAGHLPIRESFYRRHQNWVRLGIGLASITVGYLAVSERHTYRHTTAEDSETGESLSR